ncbi:MAG: phosphonate ABC transporter, permease protein PhnE [Clostridia bacterium]|nr:phosphonate ABC transporter, permease protein PhnE [Clostridia bacterium]
MQVSEKIRHWFIAAAIAALLFWCAADIDWSTFRYFSWGSFKGTMSSLLHPDWSAFYTGSTEDIFSLMLMTIAIGFFGTSIGTILAVPFTLLSARNLWHNPVIPRIGKFVLDVLRAFPELVYAIIFIKVVGPGPFAGVLAIGIHQVGMMGKLFTEEMERMDETAVEACHAVGANGIQTMFYARIPQLMPIYASLALNHFEIAVRSASTLGLVGAGGIGATLIFAIQAARWPRVSIILLTVIVTVFLLDLLTSWIRKKLQ